jgi:hypothetical protein
MPQEAVQGDEGGKAGGGDPDKCEEKEDIAFAAKCLHSIIVFFRADHVEE